MEQSDCYKMLPNKNWGLDGLKALIKKLTTQIDLLCRQCEVGHYLIRRTTLPVLSVLDQRFQSTKTLAFVRKHFEQSLCSIFVIFSQRLLSTYLQC